MNLHTTPSVLALSTLFACTLGCASLDRSQPPPRSSPQLVSASPSGWSPSGIVVRDLLQRELVWYDVGRDRVLALRDGERVALQERPIRTFITEPSALRAFDDGSFALINGSTLALFPVGRETLTLPLVAFDEPALDGNSIDDLWIAKWDVGTSEVDYGACHIDHGVLEPCVAVPNQGGARLWMALGTDGMPIMSDREDRIYRVAEGRAELLHDFGDLVIGMRRAGGELFVSTYMSGTYAIDGRDVRRIRDGRVLDALGTTSDFHYATFDAEYVQVDPSCEPGWFRSCAERPLWSQLVIFHSVNGRSSEVGHADCIGTESSSCYFDGFGFDGDTLIMFGNPMQRLGMGNP